MCKKGVLPLGGVQEGCFTEGVLRSIIFKHVSMFFCWFSSGENGILFRDRWFLCFRVFYGAIGVCSFFRGARHARVYVILSFSHDGSLDNDTD